MPTEREQRKVTVFCTRGQGAGAQLLLFQHPTAGVQVPAGTVEADETPAAAALRELAEETGLTHASFTRVLGEHIHDLPVGEAVLLGRAHLRSRPALDAPMTGWSLQNVRVQVQERRDSFARVLYEEHDLTQPDFPTARIHGWLPLDSLASRQRRTFIHVVATSDTPARWQHASDTDGFSTCEPFWAPITPRPSLVAGQDEWLAEFHEALVQAVVALDT